jgi:hypothetical protein
VIVLIARDATGIAVALWIRFQEWRSIRVHVLGRLAVDFRLGEETVSKCDSGSTKNKRLLHRVTPFGAVTVRVSVAPKQLVMAPSEPTVDMAGSFVH